MGHSSGEGRSSIHPTNFNTAPDNNRATLTEKGSSSFGQPYLDRKAFPAKVVQSKSSENVRKARLSSKICNDDEGKSRLPSKACNDDELVKHMSNLPGFLLRVEKESTVQEKALNFGVLDWKNLEKWRYNERMPSKYPKKSSSSNSNSHRPTNLPPKMIPNLRKQPTYHALNPSSFSSGKFPMPHDSSRFSSPKRQSAPFHQISHMNPLKEEKTVGYCKEVKEVESTNLKGKEMYNQVFQAAKSSRSVNKQHNDLHQGVELYEMSYSKTNKENNKIKESKKELLSRKGPPSSEQEKPKQEILESTFSGKVTFNGNMMSECRKGMVSEKEYSSSSEQLKHKVDRNFANKVKSPGKRNEIRFASEVNFTSEFCTSDPQNNLSLPKSFSRRSYSGSSQFSESRPSIDEPPAEAIIGNRFSDCSAPLDLYSGEFTTDIPHSCPLPFVRPLQPHSTTDPIERGTTNKKTLTVKGRDPSPTSRFGINLGRMSRSFSFKESSASPPLSSQYRTVKSGPIGNESSSENSEKEKVNSNGRGRSSPLRRLLDPILKYKPVVTVRSKDRKPEGSTFRALLHLTVKNELPCFRLVVDNSSDMLAATAKRSGKSDSCLSYTFYSFHEVKKKSMNWISQGSKSKSSGLGCKTIGQMNISCSNFPDEKECVLYGVDTQTPECQIPNKEIAAVIIKKPNDEMSDEEETRRCSGMVVVFPGGVHGTPTKGAPSSLLSRWRSGGLCDCGGWDLGCKLQILCEDQQNANVFDASMPVDRVNLFMQGKEQKVKPVLSLERFNNEFYSVELDMSISLLEAFATFVACITCRDFSEILDSNGTASYMEPIVGTDKMKTPLTTFESQIPVKYFTRPPLSPAGRI